MSESPRPKTVFTPEQQFYQSYSNSEDKDRTNVHYEQPVAFFTAVTVTRNFLHVLMISGIATHPALYGLPTKALNVPRYRPSERSRRQPAAALAGAGGGMLAMTAGEADAPRGNGRNGSAPAELSNAASGASEAEE